MRIKWSSGIPIQRKRTYEYLLLYCRTNVQYHARYTFPYFHEETSSNMSGKPGYWHKALDVDPILKMLRLKGKEKEGFVFTIVKGFYSLMKNKIDKKLLYLEFHEYHKELDFLIKEKYIIATRNAINPTIKIPSTTNFYTSATRSLPNATKNVQLKPTPPLNTSDRTRREENIEQDKEQEGKTTPTDSTFSNYSECYKWAIKTFKTHNGNQLLFDQHLGKIFNTYKKQKWTDENGCTIANKKGIIIRAMQNKDWHTKSKV